MRYASPTVPDGKTINACPNAEVIKFDGVYTLDHQQPAHIQVRLQQTLQPLRFCSVVYYYSIILQVLLPRQRLERQLPRSAPRPGPRCGGVLQGEEGGHRALAQGVVEAVLIIQEPLSSGYVL